MDVLLQGLSAETRTPFSIFIQVQLLQRGSSEHTEAISRIKPSICHHTINLMFHLRRQFVKKNEINTICHTVTLVYTDFN